MLKAVQERSGQKRSSLKRLPTPFFETTTPFFEDLKLESLLNRLKSNSGFSTLRAFQEGARSLSGSSNRFFDCYECGLPASSNADAVTAEATLLRNSMFTVSMVSVGWW